MRSSIVASQSLILALLWLCQSTGQKNKIHLSEDVYKYLEKAGKAHWAIPREGKVQAKGKGEVRISKLTFDSILDWQLNRYVPPCL